MLTTVRQRLVGSAELVRLLGVSRPRAYQLSSRADFPEPVAVLTMGKVWDLADVQQWADARGRTLLPLDAAVEVTDSAEESPRTSS